MEFKQTESGLVVPKDKPATPARNYGPTELQDEERRKLAAEGLSKLWDAMRLSSSGHVKLPGYENQDVYAQVYYFVGRLLLGRDCPEKEIKT